MSQPYLKFEPIPAIEAFEKENIANRQALENGIGPQYDPDERENQRKHANRNKFSCSETALFPTGLGTEKKLLPQIPMKQSSS